MGSRVDAPEVIALPPAIRVVGAAILRQGLLLAARRAPGGAQAGLWELPGGKVEPGEDDRTALRRELREELGVDVEVVDLLGEAIHAYDHLVVHLVAWRCHLVSGEPRPLEHEALRWLAAHELDAVTWAPADVPLLENVREVMGAPDEKAQSGAAG